MSQFFPILLAFLRTYGYPSLWLTIFIAAVGAPLPISILLLASGAFAELGDFNIFVLVLIAVSASVCGDNIGYLIGRVWGSNVLSWLEGSRLSKRLFSARVIKRSHAFFAHYGGWAVFLSRFLVGALGGVINLIAGSERLSYRAFLIGDLAGEVLGVVSPLLVGLIFGESWESFNEVMRLVSLVLLALVLIVIFLVSYSKYVHRGQSAVPRFFVRRARLLVKKRRV